MFEINSGTTAWLEVVFKNERDLEESPSFFRYRVDTSLGNELKDWETITEPSTSYEIELTPQINTIVDTGGLITTQKNIVTLQAKFGNNANQLTDRYSYAVKNLKYV